MQYILLHGTAGNRDNFWFPWLAAELEAAGHTVFRPDLPDANEPDLAKWLPHLLQDAKFTSDTVIIGHSAGCQLTLATLAQASLRVKRAILVAGFIGDLKLVPNDHPVYPRDLDWDALPDKADDWFFLNSDNDPWGCDQHQGERLREKLGGTLIVQSGEGHFGSAIFKQPYNTFPLLKALCLLA